MKKAKTGHKDIDTIRRNVREKHFARKSGMKGREISFDLSPLEAKY